MPLSLKSKYVVRKLAYIILTLAPAVLTGNIYKNIDAKVSTESKLSGLTALGHTLYNNIEDKTNFILTSLYMFSQLSCFQNLDPLEMSKQVNLFSYNNPSLFSNIYVLSSDHRLIYGVNNTTLRHITYETHIDNALKGTLSFYSTMINNEPFLQIAYPIYSAHSKDILPIGAIIATYDFDSIVHVLSSIDAVDKNIKAYILDADGTIIADSFTHTSLNTMRQLDLNKIKLSINYDSTSSFLDSSETKVNGVYFEIPNLEWTLLVTSPEFNGLKFADFISLLLGGIGAGTLTLSDILRKQKELDTVISSVVEDIPPSH